MPRILSLFLSLLVLPIIAYAKPTLDTTFGHIPLAFTVNEGQSPSPIRFTAQGSGCRMAFSPSGTTFLLSHETAASVARRAAKRSVVYEDDPTKDQPEYESFAVQLSFVDANENPEIQGENRLPWNNNYFIGNNPVNWRTNIPNYGKIRFKEIYKGIDLVYYGNQKRVKYDFVVNSGENPEQILLKYDFGQTEGMLAVNENGELLVKTPLGEMIERKPYCYQTIDGEQRFVQIEYSIIDSKKGLYRFEIGKYNSAYNLIIDPEIVFFTYIGGSDDDGVYKIEVDKYGSTFIAGSTTSRDFPVTINGYDTTYNPGKKYTYDRDIFIAKLNNSGSALEYATYLGGTNIDSNPCMALCNSGEVYISGLTGSQDFPVVSNSYDTQYHGSFDVFISKLSSNGNVLLSSTFLGSKNAESGSGIQIDSEGNIYIAGATDSPDFPTTPGAFNKIYKDTGPSNVNGFISKFDPSLSKLEFSTFLGGGRLSIRDLCIDSLNSPIILGMCFAQDIPTTQNAYDSTFNGECDAFIAKVNSSGSDLLYSTYIGGTGSDYPIALAIDNQDNIYFTGTTDLSDFPITDNAYSHTLRGSYDIFLTKLDATGTQLLYSTLIGGDGLDKPQDIFVDQWSNTYITGLAGWPNFPITPGAFQENTGSGFILKLASSGENLEYSTYLGSSLSPYSITLDYQGNVYVAGDISSPSSEDIIPTSGAFDVSFNGNYDSFILKMNAFQALRLLSPNGGEEWRPGTSHQVTWTPSGSESLRIDFSSDEGSHWDTIADGINSSKGSYLWNIPYIESHNCFVRIVSESGIIDESKAKFSISSRILTLTSPQSGESFKAGYSNEITWSSTSVDSVFIEYSIDNGINWETIEASTPALTGKYIWKAPGEISSECLIRISDYSDHSFTDTSGLFILRAYSPTVLQFDGKDDIVLVPNKPALDSETITFESWVKFYSFSNAEEFIFSKGGDDKNAYRLSIRNNNDGQSFVFQRGLDSNSRVITETYPFFIQKWYHVAVACGNDTVRIFLNGNIIKEQPIDHMQLANTKSLYIGRNDISTSGSNFSGEMDEIRFWSCIRSQIQIKNAMYDELNEGASLVAVWHLNDGEGQIVKDAVSDCDGYLGSNSGVYYDDPKWLESPSPNFILRLTNPNGGELLQAVKSTTIQWIPKRTKIVHIEYSVDNGSNWTIIAKNIDATKQTYKWELPNVQSDSCLIKIIDAESDSLFDISDLCFTISPPFIKVLNPNGGEKMIPSQSVNINWIALGIPIIKVVYSKDNGISWQSISDKSDSSTHAINWITPIINSDSCKVKISSVETNSIFDISDNVFSIKPSTINLLSPNGYELWRTDETQSIRWTSYCVNSVSLDFSVDGGNTWNSIIKGINAASGVFTWRVPRVKSSQYRVKITDDERYNVFDESDAMFSVSDYSSTIESIPLTFSLLQNCPNPFNVSTTIQFTLPEKLYTILSLYNANGRKIRTMINNYLEAGKYSISCDCSEFASGVYFYKLHAGHYSKALKMVLIK